MKKSAAEGLNPKQQELPFISWGLIPADMITQHCSCEMEEEDEEEDDEEEGD